MPRLRLPTKFPAQQTLLADIHARHLAGGPASLLAPYLAQQGIDLDDALATAAQAAAADEASKALHREAEAFSEQRHNLFTPLFSDLRGMAAFLKSLHRGNTRALGDWGLTVNRHGKLAYPRRFADAQQTVAGFLEHQAAFPAGTSPLEPYLALHALDAAALAAGNAEALARHKDFLRITAEAEAATQQRDNAWRPLWAMVEGIGQYLKKLMRGNEKALGDWGFTVDAAPPKPRLRSSTLKPGAGITLNAVRIGSSLRNVGETAVQVYRGRLVKGEPVPVPVPAGGELLIGKGWSILTVINEDTLKRAKVTVVHTR